jgi:hypothetical protein
VKEKFVFKLIFKLDYQTRISHKNTLKPITFFSLRIKVHKNTFINHFELNVFSINHNNDNMTTKVDSSQRTRNILYTSAGIGAGLGTLLGGMICAFTGFDMETILISAGCGFTVGGTIGALIAESMGLWKVDIEGAKKYHEQTAIQLKWMRYDREVRQYYAGQRVSYPSFPSY